MMRVLKFHFRREHFILKKMTKKYSFLLLLMLGCQNEWLDSEKNDFRARCNNPDILLERIYSKNFKREKIPIKTNKKERAVFCDCVLNQLLLSDLSYDAFLKQDLEELKTQDGDSYLNQISNTCLTD